MNFVQWLDATSPVGKKLSALQRMELRSYRKTILDKAGTTMNTLSVAKNRGVIGLGLAMRLEAATAGTFAEIKVADQFPAANEKEQDWAA